MKSSIFVLVLSVTAWMISAETSLTFYKGTGEESSFNDITKTCLHKYENREFITSPPRSLKSFTGCEDLNLTPHFLQPMSSDDLHVLINNTQRLLTLIEDFSHGPMPKSGSNAHLNLVEMTKMVLHQANTPCPDANETETHQLVHLILRLNSQFVYRFPDDADEPAWVAFFTQHDDEIRAILSELQPNIKILVDFMNNNHANFTNQPEVMTEFTKLYENVFNANFVNKTSAELQDLEPESWALLFDILDKAPEDSDIFKTLSRFNRTKFFAVNRDQIADKIGTYLITFMTDVKDLLTMPTNTLPEDTSRSFDEILNRYPIFLALVLRLDDFFESNCTCRNAFAMYCDYATTQHILELKYDARLMNDSRFIDLTQRMAGIFEAIKERVLPEDDQWEFLGASYDTLSQEEFDNYVNTMTPIVRSLIVDHEYIDETSSSIMNPFNTLLHNVGQIKLEKQLLVSDEQLDKLKTLMKDYRDRFSDDESPQYQLVQVVEDSFDRIFAF